MNENIRNKYRNKQITVKASKKQQTGEVNKYCKQRQKKNDA